MKGIRPPKKHTRMGNVINKNAIIYVIESKTENECNLCKTIKDLFN